MANALTICRIALSLALLALPALSPTFLLVYATSGITDMLDGYVARKTGTTTELGERLDSAADLVLAAVCLWKVVPVISVPTWLLVWVASIVLLRACNIGLSIISCGHPLMLHTPANKVAGLLSFLVPLILPLTGTALAATPACVVATCATIQEGLIIHARASATTRRCDEKASATPQTTQGARDRMPSMRREDV